MQILSAIGDKTDYTWDQALRYFIIGALKACAVGSIPAIIAAWHNYRNYTDDTDWGLVWELAGTGVSLKFWDYYEKHKAYLKMPPFWAIPAEFEPTKVTIERSEHTTVQTQLPDGTVKTEISPHTSTKIIEAEKQQHP